MRAKYRVLTVGAIAGAAVLAVAGPALAHVEVSADKTTAGAENVTVTFNGEAERDDAGIQSERVVLPAGIDPASVTLVKAPAGWTFKAVADGFTVGGKALKTGADAEWSVRIAKLPAGQTRLSFKTLETYGNGEVDRWIEIQQAGQDEPEHPAPLLTLKPGAPASSPVPAASSPAPSSAAPSSPAPVVVATTTSAAALVPAADDSGSTWWIWVLVAVVVLAALAFVLLRRRGKGSTDVSS